MWEAPSPTSFLTLATPPHLAHGQWIAAPALARHHPLERQEVRLVVGAAHPPDAAVQLHHGQHALPAANLAADGAAERADALC